MATPTVTNTLSETQVLGFKKFPPEIREMIFALCLQWDGKTPELLAALRQNKELYPEALALFHKQKPTYVFSAKNNWTFGEMSDKAIASVKRVKIMATKVCADFLF
jgi:hypothetical protein